MKRRDLLKYLILMPLVPQLLENKAFADTKKDGIYIDGILLKDAWMHTESYNREYSTLCLDIPRGDPAKYRFIDRKYSIRVVNDGLEFIYNKAILYQFDTHVWEVWNKTSYEDVSIVCLKFLIKNTEEMYV